MILSKRILLTKPFPKNVVFIIAAILSFGLADISVGTAQEEDLAETQRQDPEQALQLQGVYKAEHLLEKPVKNPKNEDLGKINELVVDESGQVKYAVLSHGGLLGMGEKLTAVAWDLLQISPDSDHYILNLEVSKEQLSDNAPSFSEDNWPTEAQLTEFSTFETNEREESELFEEDENNSI